LAFGEPMPKNIEEMKDLHSPSYLIWLICTLAIWIFNIYDAYRSARNINNGDLIVESAPGRSAFIFLRTIFLSSISLVVLLPFIIILTGSLLRSVMPNKSQPVPKQAISTPTDKNLFEKTKKTLQGFVKQAPSATPAPRVYKIYGIFYSENNSLAMIGGSNYRVNDSILGGIIINISEHRITIKFPDKEKEYGVGDTISD